MEDRKHEVASGRRLAGVASIGRRRSLGKRPGVARVEEARAAAGKAGWGSARIAGGRGGVEQHQGRPAVVRAGSRHWVVSREAGQESGGIRGCRGGVCLVGEARATR